MQLTCHDSKLLIVICRESAREGGCKVFRHLGELFPIPVVPAAAASGNRRQGMSLADTGFASDRLQHRPGGRFGLKTPDAGVMERLHSGHGPVALVR